MRNLRYGVLALLAGLSACGGGGGGATSPTTSPLETISLVMLGSGSLETSSSFKLSDASASGLQALWDFGDGSQSSSLNPEHSYVKPGSYTVSVRLSLPSGASKTLSVDLHIVESYAERSLWIALHSDPYPPLDPATLPARKQSRDGLQPLFTPSPCRFGASTPLRALSINGDWPARLP